MWKTVAIVFSGLMFLVAISWLLGIKVTEKFTESKDDKKVMLFHAEWCGHCKNFMPEWNKFKGMNVCVCEDYEVDDPSTKKMFERYNVSSFPTIKLVKNGKTEDYQGERTAEALKETMSA